MSRGAVPGGGQFQIADHGGQAFAFNELHGVVVHAALAAHRVDRHNVLVIQVGGRLRFVLETLQLLGIQRCREG